MTTPTQLDPAPAYESAHLIARDLLADIRRQLKESLHPNDANVRWRHARAMNRINAQLSDISDMLDALNNRTR